MNKVCLYCGEEMHDRGYEFCDHACWDSYYQLESEWYTEVFEDGKEYSLSKPLPRTYVASVELAGDYVVSEKFHNKINATHWAYNAFVVEYNKAPRDDDFWVRVNLTKED